jgi:membrane protease YdiL (CAAX protease family)
VTVEAFDLSPSRSALREVQTAVAVAVVVVAEVVLAVAGVVPGVACLALAVFALLNAEVLAPDGDGLFAVVALVPLLSILGVTIPTREVSQLYWYPMVALPLLAAVAIAARGRSLADLGLRLPPRALLDQLPVIASGAPLSLLAYLLLRPEPLVRHAASLRFLLALVLVVAIVALSEELLFRGLLQHAAVAAFGPVPGTVLVNALFAAAYAGSVSAVYAVGAGLAGIWLSVTVDRTRTIWGAVAAHAFFAAGLLLVWPLVWV